MRHYIHYTVTRLVCLVFASALAAVTAAAADPTANPGKDTPAGPDAVAKEATAPPASVEKDQASGKNEDRNSWYFIWGMSNVHPDLKPSEAQINRDMNEPLRLIMPGYRDVRTFRGMEKDFEMWDPQFGAARDLNKWLTLFATGGVVAGEAQSRHHYYPLLIKTSVLSSFKRFAAYAALGLDYYPLGKPHKEPKEAGNTILRSLRGIRPVLELSSGYVYVSCVGEGQISMPLVGSIYKKRHVLVFHEWNVSPRVGFEIPITPRNSISLMGGYQFLLPDNREYNGPCMVLMHHLKF